jgi:hypothetical protein
MHRSDTLWLLLVAVAACVVCAPFLRTVYWLGDEGVLLHGAEEMLHGRGLYRDFFEFLPPGGFVLTAAWLSLTGISFVAARLLGIVTVVGTACFTFLASQRASKNAPLSALLTTLWLAISQGEWTQVSHHWFTTMFSMLAAWAAIAAVTPGNGRYRWPLIAGLAAGAGAMVTPTRGALAMLAALIAFLNLRQQRVELVLYLVACAVVPLALLGYVILNDAFTPAFQDVLVLTAKRYTSIQSVPFGHFSDLQRQPNVYVFPLAFLLLCYMVLRERRLYLDDHIMRTCAAFSVAGFLGCFPRPDVTHIAFCAPMALPLLTTCATQLTRSWRTILRYLLLLAVVVACVPSVRTFSWAAQRAWREALLETPRGRVAIIDQPGARELLTRVAATPPNDGFFFYPYLPLLPFLTARQHVSKYDIFVPGYSLDFEYEDACKSALKYASWLVLDRRWMDPHTLKSAFPNMGDTSPPETVQLQQILASSYLLVAKEGPLELRFRRGELSDAICNGIAK